ncbi:hypothetical protein GR160_17390 [Flavobacterium sp. Sd200]|uniref:hypothetical protein n=1 Tax=Flavobacterium sp. Sd200 TaxID=2692211 RepID=UPI00137164A2|nr:hypothetical protein [Flavobacterium sp. Sd200]MXN93003.1 hypothetical protein [Flavobacterium sp. Sd200]
MKYLEKIQTLLPLGYLYLILLGLLDESIQYYQLGINILNFSSITDILLRPIAEMFSGPILLIVSISFFLLLFVIQNFIVQQVYKNRNRKILGRIRYNETTSKKEIKKAIFPIFILFFAFELLTIFVGIGLGGGEKIAKAIKTKNFTYNYRVNFSSGKTEDVYLFDMNSLYYFYTTKDSNNIKIAPVGSINSLELINNKKLK